MGPISPRPTRRRSTGFLVRRITGSLIVLCGAVLLAAQAASALGLMA